MFLFEFLFLFFFKGCKNGACTYIQNKLQKNLLLLACRHHVLEIVLAAVFKECFGVSSGPDVLLFKRFQDSWPNINKTNYQSAICSANIMAVVNECGKQEIINFALDKLAV